MTALEFNYAITGMQKNLEFFAYSLTSDTDDAKDLLQETYLKALVNREKFVHQTNLKAWMFTIMKNTFINNYRRAVKSNTIMDTTDDLYFLNSSVHSTFPGAESRLSEQDMLQAIESLEDEYRIPFQMHTQGFKYKEIAEQLDLSIGTVKSRIFFTRKKLMEKLPDYQN